MMLVFMANGACRNKLAFQIALNSVLRFTARANHNFDIPLVEDFNRAAAHAAADDDVYPAIRQKIRQKAGPVSRVWNVLLPNNRSVFLIKDDKTITMTKVFCYLGAFPCYCDSHNLSFLPVS